MSLFKKGTNLTTVRENNRALIIRLIHKKKLCSRVELALETGLQQATISNIINELMDWGLVIESGNIKTAEGRRTKALAINNEVHRLIGARINRDYISVGLFDFSGTMLSHRKQTLKEGFHPADALKLLQEKIEELIQLTAPNTVLGIGVAIPGPFFTNSGKIGLMSGFPGWETLNIQAAINECFSLPVYVEHDANCGALAELWYGNVSPNDVVAFVAADVGVGASILSDGKIFTGSMGVAGEIGHISIDYSGPRCECGSRGCLELYCSTRNLMKLYRQEATATATKILHQTTDAVLSAVVQGDAAAIKAFQTVATFLGIGLVNVINAYNPNTIILADRLATVGTILIESIDTVLKERLLEELYLGTEVRLATFVKEDTMLFGASALVLERIVKKPSKNLNLSLE